MQGGLRRDFDEPSRVAGLSRGHRVIPARDPPIGEAGPRALQNSPLFSSHHPGARLIALGASKGESYSMPRIVRFHQVGGPEVLHIEDLPSPTPKKGEVRIRVEAIGLNRAEIMFRSGHYLEQPKFPSSLGYEAAGVVEEVGPGVTGLSSGDRVSSIPSFSMVKYGTYGEVAVLPAYAVAKYPARERSGPDRGPEFV